MESHVAFEFVHISPLSVTIVFDCCGKTRPVGLVVEGGGEKWKDWRGL